jgi:hypothetical protein
MRAWWWLGGGGRELVGKLAGERWVSVEQNESMFIVFLNVMIENGLGRCSRLVSMPILLASGLEVDSVGGIERTRS